jgi:hypothetical protein
MRLLLFLKERRRGLAERPSVETARRDEVVVDRAAPRVFPR